MLSSFICGSFQSQLEVEDESWISPSSTPERSSPLATPRKSRKSSKTSKTSKNPYSSRGLDKFSALLAELEEKKQQIYSQLGPEDVPMVRFVYSSSNDCIPLIVKVKDQKQDKPKISSANDIKDNPISRNNDHGLDKLPIEAPAEVKQVEQPRSETAKKTEKKSFTCNVKLHIWRRPNYYMPVALILILLLLVLFGRSAAILLISLAWYIIPALSTKQPTQKKDYVRRLSEPKMMTTHRIPSPPRKSTGSMACKWPRQHGQRQSF
ncbi:ZCF TRANSCRIPTION FACTOR [Salix suchowensis]|nr:ZCF TRANSCRIPTION FACTOR [Salix suchowensis]